jgi:hypothetical protein
MPQVARPADARSSSRSEGPDCRADPTHVDLVASYGGQAIDDRIVEGIDERRICYRSA